ncbi:MAG: urease accessory protein [Paracoccaceae bacterium]|jgi:urease accessory protein
MPHAHILRAATAPTDTITLAYDDRWRRRARLTSDGGIEFVLDLPEASELRHGMALELSDGREIAISAAPEPLTEVLGHDAHHLLRLCWHLGNRHLPVQIEPGRLVIRRDRVLEDMLRHLGAHLHEITEPFTPEGGAYGHGRTHGHSHGDAHDDPNAHIRADDGHAHDHRHDHSHAHPDAPA